MKEGGDKVFGTIVLKYSQVHIIKFNYLFIHKLPTFKYCIKDLQYSITDTIMNSDKFFSAVDGYKRYKVIS